MLALRSLTLLCALAFPQTAMAKMCWCFGCSLFNTYENLYAPSSSMEPTLPIDQCFRARNLHDDFSGLTVGDIVTFQHPVKGELFVKRLIALDGDTIQMLDGRLVLNGETVAQIAQPDQIVLLEKSESGVLPRCINEAKFGAPCHRLQFTETLPNGVSYNVLGLGTYPNLDDTPEFTVPADHVFVMGDHRDNSTDSRLDPSVGGIGFVPISNIVGVVELKTK